MDSQHEDLLLTFHQVNGHAIVHVAGEIDILTEPAMSNHLRDAIDDGSVRVLTLDLSRVTFIDGRGLSALHRAKTHAHSTDTRLHLANLTPRLLDLLRITHLEHLLDTEVGSLSPADPYPSSKTGIL